MVKINAWREGSGNLILWLAKMRKLENKCGGIWRVLLLMYVNQDIVCLHHKNCFFDLSSCHTENQVCLNYENQLWRRIIIECESSCKVSAFSCQILIEIEICLRIVGTIRNVCFHENPPLGIALLFAERQADIRDECYSRFSPIFREDA
jgi:hypothetical protein